MRATAARQRRTLKITTAALLLLPVGAGAQTSPGFGSEEFGMSRRALVQAIERGEQLIAQCMQEEGFQYIAADYNTVHAGMKADKSMPGLSEEEFINKYGFGVATMYSGQAPQLSTGYSPARVGLGERNIEIFKSLSTADRVAYNRALFGESTGASFTIALETENLSITGGCTRKAIDQVFDPEKIKPSYYNPQNALINNDPRMKAALRKYAAGMKQSGFDYNHPDDVEPDIRARLAALTANGTVPVDSMTEEQRNTLKKLQDFERQVASRSFALTEQLLTPVEEQIQQELFARKVQ